MGPEADASEARDYDLAILGGGPAAFAAALRASDLVLPLSNVPRAIAARDTRGFVKVLRKRGADELVGMRVLAAEGGEQIMEASLMIRFGLPISGVARHFHPYRTQSEAVKLALLRADRACRLRARRPRSSVHLLGLEHRRPTRRVQRGRRERSSAPARPGDVAATLEGGD